MSTDDLTATVAALRRDLEGLRRRLDSNSGGTAADDGLGDRVACIDENIQELAGAVDEHTAALAALGDSDTDDEAPAVVCWLDMTDAPQAREALHLLGTWIKDILPHYAPRLYQEILPCWLHHSDVVQLLFDLHGAYERAYHADGRVFDAWDIRTRYVPHTKRALAEAFGDCAGGHGSRAQFTQLPEDPMDNVDLDAVADAWVTARTTPD